MKFEDILEKDESRADFAIKQQRFSLYGESQCRIYRFEKKLGVNLVMYCDHFDPCIYDEANIPNYSIDINAIRGEGPFLMVKVEALNVETNQFEEVELRGGNAFPFMNKKTSRVEMILSPEHINDDSVYTIRVTHRFLVLKQKRTGFLLRKVTSEAYVTQSEQVELKCVLTSQQQTARETAVDAFDYFDSISEGGDF